MGRPLPKRFFGDLNVGGLGGSYVLAAAVSGPAGGYTTRPTITFTAPELAGGVTATATINSKAKSASISGTQTRAYPVGTGSIIYGTATWTPTVTSSALSTVVRDSATTLGFDTTTTAMISGTSIHITGASITGTMTIGGVAIAAGQIYYAGAPTTATTATLYATYADSQAATSPLTIVAGTGTGGATFTRGVTYGTVTAVAVAAVGSFTTLAAGAQDVTTDTAGVGEGLQITVTYEALSTTITEAGTGYLAAPTQAGGTFDGTLGTVTMASAGSYPAIICTAQTTSGGSALTGDIVNQRSTRRYKVTTADGTGVCKLVAASPTFGEMTIIATDYSGNTYYITKLTRHLATLTQNTGSTHEFATGASAGWKTDALVAGDTGIYVQIANS
jgi:hypothetical protein